MIIRFHMKKQKQLVKKHLEVYEIVKQLYDDDHNNDSQET